MCASTHWPHPPPTPSHLLAGGWWLVVRCGQWVRLLVCKVDYRYAHANEVNLLTDYWHAHIDYWPIFGCGFAFQMDYWHQELALGWAPCACEQMRELALDIWSHAHGDPEFAGQLLALTLHPQPPLPKLLAAWGWGGLEVRGLMPIIDRFRSREVYYWPSLPPTPKQLVAWGVGVGEGQWYHLDYWQVGLRLRGMWAISSACTRLLTPCISMSIGVKVLAPSSPTISKRLRSIIGINMWSTHWCQLVGIICVAHMLVSIIDLDLDYW